MVDEYLSRPPEEMRRQDRALDEAQIRALLRRAPYGALATVHGGQPFINSNLFFYDEGSNVIYLHTALVGRTRANVAAGGRVCFSVSEMGRLLPADEALEFSVEYAGVAVFGTAEVVSEKAEMRHGLQSLLDKYFPHLLPGEHYRPITDEELARTTVLRIDIERWSGKAKQVSQDFPGAFDYNQFPGEWI